MLQSNILRSKSLINYLGKIVLIISTTKKKKKGKRFFIFLSFFVFFSINVSSLSQENQFCTMYRMSRDSFNILLGKFRNYLQVNKKMSVLSTSKNEINPEIMLHLQ